MRLRASKSDASIIYENGSWANRVVDHRLGYVGLPYSAYKIAQRGGFVLRARKRPLM
jgi:hypothetical protein